MDIKYQSLTHPFITLHIHQCQAVVWPPPFPPPTFCQIMCSDWSVLLGLADYSEGERREGGSATAARAAKRDKSSRGTPPLVRWTSLPHSRLLLLPSPSPFFPLLPSSLLLHYSSVRRQSPAHGSSCCCCSSRSIEPAGSPRLQLLLSRTSVHPPRFPFPSMETQSWPFSAAERESEPPSSCSLSCWEEEKPERREERIFFPPFFFGCWRNPDHLPLICPHPPFLDYSSGFV